MGTLGDCGRVQELDFADIQTGLFGHTAQPRVILKAMCQFSSIMELNWQVVMSDQTFG